MKKRDSVKTLIPTLLVESELYEEMKRLSQKKGYPMPMLRRRAYALYVNQQRIKEGLEPKMWLEV